MRRSAARLCVLVLAFGSAVASVAFAQKLRRIEPLPPSIAGSFDLVGGTVQRLALPPLGSSAWTPFHFDVVLGRDRLTIAAEPYDLRAADFRMIGVATDGTERELAPFARTTYRGVVVGMPEATAALNLYQGQLTGVIFLGEETWAIQPATERIPWLPRDAHVVYREDDLIPRSLSCPVEELLGGGANGARTTRGGLGAPRLASRASAGGGSGAALSAPHVAEIAIELDRDVFGYSESAVAHALAILNAVDVIYRRDVNVTFELTGVVLRDGGYPYANGNKVLGAFIDAWKSHPVTIKRDLAHLFTSYSSGPLAGLALLAAVCKPGSHYSVSWDYSYSVIAAAAVTAHELGHTFGASHCTGNGCFLMCAYIGGCGGSLTKFGTVSASVIRRAANNATCLDN